MGRGRGMSPWTTTKANTILRIFDELKGVHKLATPSSQSEYVTHSHKTHRKSPEYFLRYRPINISQVNRKERNFQEKYWLFMVKTLSEYGKWAYFRALNFSSIFKINKSEKLFSDTYGRFCWSGSHISTKSHLISVLVKGTVDLSKGNSGSQKVIFWIWN